MNNFIKPFALVMALTIQWQRKREMATPLTVNVDCPQGHEHD